MVVLLLVLAAGLVAMGCVKADRVRRWRRSFNPSAPELPDSAFVAARVVLFGMAGVGVFSAFQFMAVVADAEWSDDELSSAVSQAAEELNGTSRFGDIFGDDSGFDEESATMIEDEVVEHGGGGAPQSGVDRRPRSLEQAFRRRLHSPGRRRGRSLLRARRTYALEGRGLRTSGDRGQPRHRDRSELRLRGDEPQGRMLTPHPRP